MTASAISWIDLERPALRDVAAALRVLGWTQQRDWRKAGNNRRVWIKNGDSKNKSFSENH